MPGLTNTKTVAKSKNYTNTYENSLSSQNRDLDVLGDSSFRSYMAQGNSFFANDQYREKVNGQSRTRSRADVINGIRSNIIARLKRENALSANEATKIRAEHESTTTQIVTQLMGIEKKTRDKNMLRLEIDELYGTQRLERKDDIIRTLEEKIRSLQADLDSDRAKLQLQQNPDSDEDEDEDADDSMMSEQANPGEGEGSGEQEDEIANEEDLQGSAGEGEGRQPLASLAVPAPQPMLPSRDARTSAFSADETDEKAIQARESDLTRYRMTLQAVRSASPSRLSGFRKLFSGLGRKVGSREKQITALTRQISQDKTAVEQKAVSWRNRLIMYEQDQVRKHNAAYDEMAATYYELSHSSALPADADDNAKAQARENRKIPDDAKKEIVEYNGVYDVSSVRDLVTRTDFNPYVKIDRDNIRLQTDPRISQIPGGEAGDDPLSKKHTKIAMFSAPDRQGRRTRYEFDNDFTGTKSRFQPGGRGTSGLRDVSDNGQPGEFTDRIRAEDADLSVDAKDGKGRFLFSAENVNLIRAKRKEDGSIFTGFYRNGRFYSDEDDGHLTDKEGFRRSYFRSDWVRQDKAEQLREAIRRSPFFRHVNSATIQAYAGYNVNADFGKQLKDASLSDEGKRNVAYATAGDFTQQIFEQLDPVERSACIIHYIIRRLSPQDPNETPFNINDPDQEPFISQMIVNKQQGVIFLKQLLFNSDQPRLWILARNVIEKHPGLVDPRTVYMMKKLPKTGELMRTGLLDELANHQGEFSEFNTKKPRDITGFIQPYSRFTVWLEEAKSQRGMKAWWKRQLAGNSVFGKILGFATQIYSGINDTTDAVAKQQIAEENEHLDDDHKKKFELSDEETARRANVDTWSNYVKSLDSTNRVLRLFGLGAIATGAALGGFRDDMTAGEGATAGADAFAKAMDINRFLTAFAQIIAQCRRFHEMRLESKERKNNPNGNDTELRAFGEAGIMVKSISEMVRNFTELAKGLNGFVGYSDSLSDTVANNVKLAKLGLNLITDICKIVESIVDWINAHRRIGRMHEAEEKIKTALSLVSQAQESAANGQNPAKQPTQEQQNLASAAEADSQVLQFLEQTKMAAHKDRSEAVTATFSNSFAAARDAAKISAKVLKDPISVGVAAGLSLAPAITDFIGWTYGKLRYDRKNFNNSIASMLGDAKYADAPYFNRILRQETGIVSSHYLVDISRIFTAIDTQVLLNKDPIQDNEKQLASMVLGTMYKNVNPENMKKTKLSELLKFAGLDSSTNWRSLLRNSLSA